MKLCGAKTRSGGECKKAGSGAGGRCRLHGGASLSGIASPRFKTGRWSKYVAAGAADRYHASLADTELIALRDDIALLDVRIGDVLGKIGTGESGEHWRGVKKAFDDFRSANAKEDVAGAKTALTELASLIQKGASEAQQWVEIANLLERRRRLVDSEQRRLVEMQAMVSAERVMGLVAALSNSVRKYVSDPQIRRSIANEFRRLIGADSRQLPDGGRSSGADDRGTIDGLPAGGGASPL